MVVLFGSLLFTKEHPFRRLRYRVFLDTHIYRPYAHFMYGAIVVFLFFTISDKLVLQQHADPVVFARIFLASSAAVLLYCASRYQWRCLPILEVALFISAGFIVHFAGAIALSIGNTNYQSGSILLMLYIGTFSRLSFGYSLTAIIGIILPYILYVHPALAELEAMKESNHYMVVLSTALFCILGSYRRALETRTRFEESQKIRSQSIKLAAYSQRLKDMSETDALTKIHNRHYLNQWIHHAEQAPRPLNLTFVMLDIDHFKQVNDRDGHHAGDLIIRKVASVLASNKPANGQLIRYGGEEFLLILPEGDIQRIASQVEHLRQKCSVSNPNGNANVTVSAGVYIANHHNDSVLAAINYADKALYKAKASGRNQTVMPQWKG